MRRKSERSLKTKIVSIGAPATLNHILNRIRSVDVVFLGEQHDDPVAHHLAQRILERVVEQRKWVSSGRSDL